MQAFIINVRLYSDNPTPHQALSLPTVFGNTNHLKKEQATEGSHSIYFSVALCLLVLMATFFV